MVMFLIVLIIICLLRMFYMFVKMNRSRKLEGKKTLFVYSRTTCFNLSYDGGFTDLSYDEGGLKVPPPPIFICENHRESNKIMHCVEKKKYLIGSFKDKAIFHVILKIDR